MNEQKLESNQLSAVEEVQRLEVRGQRLEVRGNRNY